MKPVRCGGYTLTFDRTLLMGVLNVTPDSFSDGGRFLDFDIAVEHAREMVEDGADILDIGGESTRPGSESVSEAEELGRVLPVIEKLVGEVNVPVSIDTCKPGVADECLKAGAHMLNDITGLTDRRMIEVAAEHGVPAVAMHMKGTPKNMQQNPVYGDVVAEIIEFLGGRVGAARDAGVEDVIVDPGIGFGKTTEHNLQILKRLGEFRSLGCPVLVGPSRKSFIGNVTGLPVDERLEGTLAAVAVAAMNGADIIRVHDVRECRRAAQVADAVRYA